MAGDPLERFVLDCRALFGDELESVFLYGSAADEDFLPGYSDYNLGVVLREVRPEHIHRAAAKARAWARARIAPPLFLDPAFIRESLDVFPIEFLEIKETHRSLYGPDPFLNLTVSLVNLRQQCELEVKGKLLALYAGALRAGASREKLLAVATDSLKPILLVLRNYLRLSGESAPHALPAVLDRIEARAALALPAIRRLIGVREGRERLRRGEVRPFFDAYLEEVRVIAGRFNALLEGARK
jgi:predicted nucleotidyltransferase